jgi:outer membrane protein assembly factor BamE (lipoprotein component of BamABCDE complex)
MRGPAVLALAVSLFVAAAGCSSSPKPDEVAARPPTPPATPQQTPAAAPPPPQVRLKDGRIADEEILKKLIQGKTTKDEVRAMFGIPQGVVYSPGMETYIYYREKTSGLISRKTERVESLTLRFDLGGILKDFEYRSSGE